MSDICEQMEHLKANIDLNTVKRSSGDYGSNDFFNGCNIRCIPLMFGSAIIHEENKNDFFPQISNFDVILGSDIGFDISLHTLLAKSINGLAGEFTVTLIAEEVRWKDIYTWFKSSLEEVGIDVEKEVILHCPSITPQDVVEVGVLKESNVCGSAVTSSCPINLLNLRKRVDSRSVY
mmetsp:Transcript_5496/g.8149  ORF Transcript_5496/g.8149 Transcript_5496/m.8149 type:complete len:177 (-) Transcript_5496:25-555(-)|eukprot:CAMPEP_0170076078 /NCGR_PEP_ID=MMETSP0019_2-20121128/13108_1 /TAXON_ID=98059 /ORGANISM="Dinobryon sp., Strain UTEXLB2267" /LENGTH=176 /DNA_ID=CAMNT_0010287473 /DNA_START=312 /DNA_END=842 /DNA_ORIENTATION=-